MQPIFLTGFMGAGKTTVGRLLAEALDCDVKDTDETIERLAGKTIKAIFTDEGEKAFRDLETEALRTETAEDVVVTTGGGMVIREMNRLWMRRHGVLCYLHCDIDEVFRRIGGDPERPLLMNKQQHDLRRLQKERQVFYDQADYRIDTSSRSPEEVTAHLLKWLNISQSSPEID